MRSLKIPVIAVGGVLLIAMIAVFLAGPRRGPTTDAEGRPISPTSRRLTSGGQALVMVSGDIRHTVPLDQILPGGPPRDGIPSIDKPVFESVRSAENYLDDDGLGIAVSHDGIDRFYPFQILNWHEIVNDVIEDKPVLVTYCPLCGTGIVFDPTVGGKRCEFGTSGKLYQSNLVMYDRCTETYWSQVLGEAIVGELAGAELALVPHKNMRWRDWRRQHPGGEVLSRNTGHRRNYERSPYGDYATSQEIFFPVDNEDPRYHRKEPVWGIRVGATTKAYPLSELRGSPGSFSDDVGGEPILVAFDHEDDTVLFHEASTGDEVIPVYGFWFSWVSVHPDTEVYTAPGP